MVIALIVIGWLLGVMLGSFAMLPVLIIISFAIPHTVCLNRRRFTVPGNPIIRNYLVSATLLGGIFLCVSLAIAYLAHGLLAGFVTALVMVLLFGMGSLGGNQANMAEYESNNSQYFLKQATTPNGPGPLNP